MSSCQITYYLKSAYNQAKILGKRVPIEKALQNPKLDEKTKHKLTLILDARRFAEKNLGLKSTNNYSAYTELDRPYVSWILHASPAFELKHHLWHFPFVGNVPYKGFFSEKEAIEEAKAFPSEEYDTYIRGVTAYSTLGWFEDPILSTMIKYADHDLVNLIIHETVHTTVYIKSQADFNEQLATFLGNVGTELYYREREGNQSPTLKKIAEENEDEKIFSSFISQETDHLSQWYEKEKNNINLSQKKIRLQEINHRFKNNILPTMKTSNYKYFADQELNNAKLLSFKTYVYDLSLFARVLNKMNQQFSQFLDFTKTLEKEKDPRKKMEDFLR